MKNLGMLLFLVVALSLLSYIFLSGEVNAQEGSVTATVTIGEISVNIAPASFNYGSMPYSSVRESFDVIDVSGDQNIKATVGSVLTDLDIKGADTAAWALSDTVIGADQYMHRFSTSANATTRPGAYTPLTTTYSNVLGTDITANADVWFGLRIDTPSSGISTQQSAVVTVLASWAE